MLCVGIPKRPRRSESLPSKATSSTAPRSHKPQWGGENFLHTASYHGDTYDSLIITKAGGKELTTRQKDPAGMYRTRFWMSLHDHRSRDWILIQQFEFGPIVLVQKHVEIAIRVGIFNDLPFGVVQVAIEAQTVL